MKERPIIFSGDDVRAILDGRKRMTRRVIAHQPNEQGLWPRGTAPGDMESDCPYGTVGDRLWVREAFRELGSYQKVDGKLPWRGSPEICVYKADAPYDGPFRPSIHMPRWASRITLEITEVRVERLQSISEEDAKAEGVQERSHTCGGFGYYESGGETWECECMGWNHSPHVMEFVDLWNFINGKKHPWAENPWVWVLGFEVVK